MQALAYEACDRKRTPLHMPKTELCKKIIPCLVQKASRCAADCISKTSVFLSLTFHKHKDLTKKTCVFIFYFIGSLVKIMFLCSLHKGWQTSKELKRNINDGTIIFLASVLTILAWKIVFSFLSDTRYFHVLNEEFILFFQG